MRTRVIALLSIVCALTFATASHGAATPQQKCQASKNKTAATYASCRQNAEAKRATSGNEGKYNDTLAKCRAKFARAWQKAIDKATKKGVTCPDAPLIASTFQSVIDDHTDNVASALRGWGLTDLGAELATCNGNLTSCQDALATCQVAVVCGDGTIEGEEECEVGNLNGQTCATQGFLLGTLRCGARCTFDTSGCFATRFVDNGDGTVTDNNTGLMWEKKSDDDTIHDKDKSFTWGTISPPYEMNGTMVTEFLAALNAGGGFAGYTDWRVPNVNELQSIVNYENRDSAVSPAFDTDCATACTVLTCSCTVSDDYWSAIAYADLPPRHAWLVNFLDGQVRAGTKSFQFYVRAVRGSS
jgi:hypothetical protein